MPSVFLVLMGRPKLAQALEKQSMSFCIFCSLLALSAQSSANVKSLMTVSFTFVTAFNRLGLNSLPSILYLTGIPFRRSRKASISMAEKTILQSVGTRTRPCFTPFVTGIASYSSPSSSSFTILPSWNCRTICWE